MAERVLTYALGRGLEPTDRVYVDHIDTEAQKRGYTLDSMIELIALSEPFRMRRGEPEEGQ